MSAAQVLQHHLGSFASGDLDGIMDDYTDDSVLFTPDGPLKGRDAIRGLLGALITEFSKPGASYEMKTQTVEDEIAFIVWSAETADNVYELATDTFVVRDGKIRYQSFAGKIVPKSP